jgi:hypothetical protein
MFDRVYLGRPRSTTVNINQKPNDAADSARLLKELTEKAEKEVYGATIHRLGAENEVKVVRIDGSRMLQDNTYHIKIIFELNGTRHTIVCQDNPDDINKSVADAIFHDLAVKVYKFLGQQRYNILK